jgi:hypothetical protein
MSGWDDIFRARTNVLVYFVLGKVWLYDDGDDDIENQVLEFITINIKV